MDNTQNLRYENMVEALGKRGELLLKELDPTDCEIIQATMGISGEAGELLDAVKKVVVYRQPINRVNIVEELGDLEFYITWLRQILCITREECIADNMTKLSKRYDKGYSNIAAQERADKK